MVSIVLSPEHAQILTRENWSKGKIKEFLFERSQVPLTRFSRENVERFLLHRWSPELQARVRDWLQGAGEGVRVPLRHCAEHVHIIVAGGAGKHSLLIPTLGLN